MHGHVSEYIAVDLGDGADGRWTKEHYYFGICGTVIRMVVNTGK